MDLTGVSNRRLLEQILINTHTILHGEMKIMASQADLDAALAKEGTDLQGYTDAVNALIAKLNNPAAPDFSAELATVTAMDNAITGAQAGLPTGNPPPPPPPPAPISP